MPWEDHVKNVDMYGNLPRLTDKIGERRMTVAGHNVRDPDLVASGLVLWKAAHGSRNDGGRRATYIGILKRDTELTETAEVRTLTEDRQMWRPAIHDSRVVLDRYPRRK